MAVARLAGGARRGAGERQRRDRAQQTLVCDQQSSEAEHPNRSR